MIGDSHPIGDRTCQKPCRTSQAMFLSIGAARDYYEASLGSYGSQIPQLNNQLLILLLIQALSLHHGLMGFAKTVPEYRITA